MFLAESPNKTAKRRWVPTCVRPLALLQSLHKPQELSVALSLRRSDIVVVVEVHGSTGNFQASQLQLKEQQSASSISVLPVNIGHPAATTGSSQGAQVSTVTGKIHGISMFHG